MNKFLFIDNLDSIMGGQRMNHILGMFLMSLPWTKSPAQTMTISFNTADIQMRMERTVRVARGPGSSASGVVKAKAFGEHGLEVLGQIAILGDHAARPAGGRRFL